MDEDIVIIQGFLCPVCKEDQGELERLHQHMDNVHSIDSSTDTINNMIKGKSISLFNF
jgi:predicted small metal-binding protein